MLILSLPSPIVLTPTLKCRYDENYLCMKVMTWWASQKSFFLLRTHQRELCCLRFLIMTLFNSNFMIIFWSHTNGNHDDDDKMEAKCVCMHIYTTTLACHWYYSWWVPQWEFPSIFFYILFLPPSRFTLMRHSHVHAVTFTRQFCVKIIVMTDWYA